MRASPIKPRGYPVEVYCDESLDRGGFDVYGGLWLTRPKAIRLRQKMHQLRERYRYHREFKWQKASGSELSPVYREFAEMLVDHVRSGNGAGFHCIVIPRALIDYKTFHNGDRELAMYKFWNLLFRKRVEAGATYLITLDRRTDQVKTRLSELRSVLNNCGRQDHNLRYDCCRDVQAMDSKDEVLVQAADLLVGAVGFHAAERDRQPNTSPAKVELCERMALKLGRDRVSVATAASERGFNVWRWRPKLG